MSPKYKLTYFDGYGVAEPIRQIFAYANKEFEDVRITHDDWPALKPTTPFGKVPVLEIDGKLVGQSISIARYLGKQFGLAGKNDWESLQCDVLVDTYKDLNDSLIKLYGEKDAEKKEELRKQLLEKDIPFYLGKFEKIVSDNPDGLLVGSKFNKFVYSDCMGLPRDGTTSYIQPTKVTWADISFATNLDTLNESAKSDLLKPYPKLKKLITKIQSNPGIKAWYEKRGPNPWPWPL